MGFATAQGTGGIAGFRSAQGTGHGFNPAQGAEGASDPLGIFGSSLKAWLKADAGVFTDAAADLEAGSAQYFSKASPTFSPTTAMTIRFSWKPESVGVWHGLVSRWLAGGTDQQFAIVQENGGNFIRVYVMNEGEAENANSATGSTALSAGQQYEIVVVYDGSAAAANRIAIYVDGVADTVSVSGTIRASLETSAEDLSVGKLTLGGTSYADGLISHVGIAASALSGAALTAAHDAETAFARRSTDYFSYFPLCESTGTREDFGSLGTNGLTAVNAPGVAAGPIEIDVAAEEIGNCPVKRWEDQSGNAVHFTQATTSAQPRYVLAAQNGRPGIDFDGSDDVLVIPSMSYGDFTKFVAINMTTAGIVTERTNGVLYEYIHRDGGAWQVGRGGGVSAYNDAATGATWLDGAAYIVTHRFDGTHAGNIVRRNGAVRTGGGVFTDDPGSAAIALDGTLGSRSGSLPCDGYIFEFFIVSAAATDAQVTAAETYMNGRWAAY